MLLLQQMIVLFIYMMLGYYGSKSGACLQRCGDYDSALCGYDTDRIRGCIIKNEEENRRC